MQQLWQPIWRPTMAGLMSIGILGIALSFNPITAKIADQPVWAQSVDPTAELFPILENINFTPEQEAQFANLRAQTRTQIESTVSTEQRQQFWQTLAQGQGVRAAIAAAQLTPNQRQQIRQILRSQRQQMSSIVTPAQRRQLWLNIRQRWRNGEGQFQP